MNNLKRIMKEKKVSPFALAVDTGYSVSSIYHISQNKNVPSLLKARDIAEYLGVTDKEIWP